MARSVPTKPDSQQGGGASVSEAEIVEAAAILRQVPSSIVEMDDQDAFARKDDEKNAEDARNRTSTAASRARRKVAKLLDVEPDALTTAVRAVEHDPAGKPTRYRYFLELTAAGIEQMPAPVAEEEQPAA